MVETPEYHGSLVAFEGPQDIISTQLRLFPRSPKILILPPLQQSAEETDASSPFDARLHILRTHEACDARTEIALKFLRDSTPDNKRLVFMNGGTASAQLSCISAICKHETNGDNIKAEALFNELIQNGIAGLKQQDEPRNEIGTIPNPNETTDILIRDDEAPDDPISKAMRAADALDLETAFLQDTDALDLATAVRPRSISVPVISMVDDDLHSATPYYVFGSTDTSQKAPIPRSTGQGEFLDIEKWRTTMTSEDQPIDPSIMHRSPSAIGEGHPYDRLRPTSAVGPSRAIVESMPSSPALLGEAFLVDLRPSVLQIQQRLKSVDRIYATAIRNQDIAICNLPQSTVAKPEVPASTQNTAEEENDSPKKPTLRSNFYSETSIPAVVKPTRAILRKRSPPPLNLAAEELKQPLSHISQNLGPDENFVHRTAVAELPVDTPDPGTGNGNSSLYSGDGLAVDTNEPFHTVLPMVEDIVIHIKGEDYDQNLETMIQVFRNGSYPVSMPPLLLEAKGDMDQLGTPTTMGSAPKLDEMDVGDGEGIVRETIPIYNPDEYDPFASHGNYASPTPFLSKQDIGSQPQDAAIISAQPTISQTPPAKTTTMPDTIFHDLDIRDCKTAVCIQNSLRSTLNVYFPSENIGYHQFNFPLLPELSSFWRPVFRDISSGDSKPTRKIDLILAIGAQKDVDRGLVGSISRSLEKLGKEPNGASRSGRLNLRYLIANTMQAFTSQPLTNQTQDNPFTNPLLLATLIIPHLETYIAAHSAIQFLILEYPGEYLSTVLALQHLIGMDLLKVAGVIDAEASSPKSRPALKKPGFYTAAPPTTTSSGKEPSPVLLSPKVYNPKSETTEKAQLSRLSFTGANFILTSTATEAEIATMISTIWQILIEISPSYIPQDVTRSNWKQSPSNTPLPSSSVFYLQDKDAPFLRAAAILGFVSSPEDEQPLRKARANYVSTGTYADLPAPMQRPLTPVRSTKASVAEAFPGSPTPRTPRTPRTAQAQHRKLRHLLGRDPATFPVAGGVETADAASYYDVEDEDDNGQFDAEERKYMPLWSHDGSPRRGSSYKALKWLGLSI